MQYVRKVFSYIFSAVFFMMALIFFSSNSQAAEKKKFVVVIDAGHGGTDFGAIENGVNEKDVNLAVALKLGDMIKKKLKDTEVIFTRNTDQFISLQKRADIANGAKADLFISLHCNSVDRSNKNRSNVLGATTYVLGRHKDSDNLAVAKRENAVVELDADDSAHYSEFDPNQDESYIIFEMTQKKNLQNSVRFASDVQKEMASAGRYSRGVHQAGFWVLWSTAMPAALIEMDFICNPEQAKFLNSKEGQDKIAGAIFNAVKNYESYFRKSLGLASLDTSYSSYNTTSILSEDGNDTSPTVAIATEMAELPANMGNSSSRTHRQASSSSTEKRQTANGAHRRRSSNARVKGSESVEQTDIILQDEPEILMASVENTDADAPASTTKSATNSKKNSSASKKSVASAGPARRDKDQAPKRKAVKQNVNVRYKILLFISDDELKANDEAFQGLSPVASFRENNKFKYTYGESLEYKEMDDLLKEVSPLFPEARVIKCYL